MTQATTLSGSQILLGFLSAGPVGLIIGQIIGQGLSSVVLGRNLIIEYKNFRSTTRIVDLQRVAVKYSRFPKILVFAHAINAAASYLPIFLITSLFSSGAAGIYYLVQRILSAPISLVGSAVGDVFRQEASELYAATGKCNTIFIRTFKKLLPFAVLMLLGVILAADYIFPILGNQWVEAAVFAKIMSIMFFFRLVTTPLSAMYLVAEKQTLDLIWQIVLFVLAAASFFIGSRYNDLQLALQLYVLTYSIMMSINIVLSYQLSLGKWHNKRLRMGCKNEKNVRNFFNFQN